MSCQIIIKFPKDMEMETYEFIRKFRDNEVTILPPDFVILVKDKEGYWEEK